MIGPRLRRLFSYFSVAALAAALLGVSPVSAANPDWDITITPTPAKVGFNHDAGFVVVISNHGPSQINDLSMVVTPLETPTALWTYLTDPLVYNTGGPASCSTTAPLTCQLGTLVAGATVTFTVAYDVPTGASSKCKNADNLTVDCFRLEVAIRAGTGDTSADQPKGKGGQSRGDAFSKVGFAEIGVGDFDGGFVPQGGDTYQTNPNITNRNIQSTGLSGAAELIGVTIEDGIPSLEACDSVTDDPACANLFAEWSTVHVGTGDPFTTAFKVTLVIRGSAVPGGLQAEDIVVVHVDDDGNVDVIGDDPGERCASATAAPAVPPDCEYVEKVGSNWRIVVWMFQNGSLKGGF